MFYLLSNTDPKVKCMKQIDLLNNSLPFINALNEGKK